MRVSKRFLAVTCSVTLLAGVFSCASEDVETEPVLRPVRAEQVFATGAARERTFSGVARAGVESKISFKVGGTVQRLAVEVGDEVRAGQVIAELDATDYRLRAEDARASLAQAQAQERNASSEYERVRSLYENRNASKQDLDAARAAHESAEASVASIQSRLELSQRQLAYCRLAAPIAGSIASLDVELNENVRAGQTVCLLTSDSDAEVEVAIPGVLIAQISEGDAVSVGFDALPGRTVPATVTEVGVAATGTATTFPVTVRLDVSDDAIRPGMAAEVTFAFGGGDDRSRTIVKTVAVGEDRVGRFVWIVVPGEAGVAGEGVVRRREVTIGELSGDGIEIVEGLADGEYVVTAGVSKLTDGQRVRFSQAGEASEGGEK
jgi:RND family efflux transporter MFP subunit